MIELNKKKLIGKPNVHTPYSIHNADFREGERAMLTWTQWRHVTRPLEVEDSMLAGRGKAMSLQRAR